MLNKYAVVMCPSCGTYQAIHWIDPTKQIFKCRSCKKSRKIKQKRIFAFSLKVCYLTESGRDAANKVKELSGRNREIGFRTYR